jgi:NhaC family Na+:H+ antiporter
VPSPESKPLGAGSGAPPLGVALLPLVALLGCFVAGSLLVGFGVEMLIVSLLLSASVAGGLAVRRGATWDDIQKVTGEKFASVLPVILILLAIGMLIGSWVLSGTIPFLIHWGIRLVDPRFFALTAFLVTGVMSLCTGTSWGSAGTMGVALMGAAAALGAPLPMVAGAVVSGAYLGDKMSPLSDSTNISAIAAGADLFAHIRHMLYTAVPSGLVSLALFTLVGLRSGDGGDIAEASRALAREIDSVLNLGPLVLLPLLAVLVAIARRVPPALALAGSALLALIVGIAYQGFGLASALAVAVRGFDGGMVADLGFDPAALSVGLRGLLERGGLYSMAPTLVVILAAFLFAATLEVSGALDRILGALLSTVRSVFGLIGATMAAGAVLISLTSHGGVTALIVGEMFQKAYRERRLAPVNLSRSLEDSVTIVEPLLPWTVSAIFMATTLEVPTVDYLPWAAFCYCGPVFSLLWAGLYPRLSVGIRTIEEPEAR